ncbi:hypothetical protein A3844_23815 [Paenibacillus helianthi]|uniref:F5/8 type C domain-containing protein n=1 Tax=Paenibacillus helianthi TaxID=1349432 RepID=A0ABX3EHH3_9BACL|nr:discoidin domain-containing protein [Paenibacillus helianthi]OKP82721.1 hypothetical protein A3844_23815 [Paenibacillus helianthi]
MMKKKRGFSLFLALVLALEFLIVLPRAERAEAALTSSGFLKTDGKFIKNNSGSGDVVTLRGTNFGGWLNFEDWMSPAGEFAFDRTGWIASASINSSNAGNAIDGDQATSWKTATAQTNGQWFQVNMGYTGYFNRIYVNAAGFTGEYPVSYQVLVSNDGTNWRDVATGSGTVQNTVIRFMPQVAQYIRVVQTGSSSSNRWSVAEFNVFSDPTMNNTSLKATASSTGAGTTAANALDGDVNTRWTSGAAQTNGQWFQMDLGSGQDISKVIIDAGPSSAGDYPRSYEVLGSADGINWTKYASAYGNSRITVAEFWWSSYMRYVRIAQTGSSSSWWSIADVSLFSNNALERTGWSVSASSSGSGMTPGNVKDGNASTRWTTGAAQSNGQWFQADMGASIPFNQIILDTEKNSTSEQDYPAGYTVQVSKDGTNWTTAASGQGRRKATPINFPAVTARYIKITQTGTSTNWWSIGEMNVYLNNDDLSMNSTYKQRFGAAAAEDIVTTHQDTWIQTGDLDNVENMGLNMIRLPIGWNELLHEDGTWKANAWTKIDWLVSEAASRNIYVLLDLHTLPGGNCPFASCGRSGPNPNEFWTNTTYQDWVVDIWEKIANRYKNNPAIAGYDLMNEPLIDYGEDTDDVNQKVDFYDRMYDAVRAIDADHTIYIAAFFDWGNIVPPSVKGWTNVVYEVHPYDMPNGKDWNAQNTLAEDKIQSMAVKQKDWDVPVLLGEYSLYHYDDVWSKWMGGLNAIHANWTNWTYKVKGDMNEGVGGYWGLYNSNSAPVPVINNDSASTITSKLQQFATSNFQANTSFINTVKKFANGDPWLATVPLDQTGWTASASSTEPGSSPSNALDWSASTRWSAGAPQANGQWFQVDMGSKKVFDQISFETKSTEKWDYPRGYDIQVSNDGTNWTTVKSGKGFGWKQAITFTPQYAQYVRVIQTGTSPDWWSIAEFHIYNEQMLSKSGWTATASSSDPSGNVASRGIDGSGSTWWASGAGQTNGQYYQVDFGRAETFNRVLIDAGTHTTDYPRGYQIQVSADASTWTTIASGTGSSPSVLVDFAPQTARYLKVVQTGNASNWWTIAELNVYGELERNRTGWIASASSTESGSSAANALDGNTANRWSSGAAQADGQSFTVDMRSNQWINHIVMDSSTSTNDYAREFVVEMSYDNTNWKTVANGEGTGPIVAVNFPITEGRYIKITLKHSSASWWSISEFRVYE